MNHRSMISRGDLLRCVAQCPGAEENAARFCGFVAVRPLPEEPRSTSAPESPATLRTPVGKSPSASSSSGESGDLALWLAVRFQPRDEAPVPPPEDVGWLTEEALADDEVRSASETPVPAPLVPWSRLWPFLHQALGCRRPGHRLDASRLIRRLARLQPVRKVPRVPRLTWARQAWLLVDRRPQLALFQAEFDELLRRLQAMRGRAGLRCVGVDGPRGLPLTADTAVLVLSDLGCLDQAAIVQEGWREFAARYRGRGTRPIALMPCPKSRWDPELCRQWQCHVWDRGHRLRHPPQPFSGREADAVRDAAERVEHLLSLVSPAIRIEPALLRGARLLLPPKQADVGTEFDAWFHQDTARTSEAMAIRMPAAFRRRVRFATFDQPTRLAMVELIRFAHHRWSPSFFARETINLHECGAPVTNEDLERAWQILRRFNKTMFQMLVDDPGRARRLRLFEWQQGDFARTSPAMRAAPETAVAWELARAWRGEQAAVIPDEIDHEAVKQTQKILLADQAKPAVWQVCHAGAGWALTRTAGGRAATSPLALFPAVSPRFDVFPANEKRQGGLVNLLPRSDRPLTYKPLADARHLVIRSDRGELDLLSVSPPAWVSRFGWDRFGMFADFEVGGVTFPLRWIPPGEFEMGSPAEEPGRWDAEGPRHRVTIGRGFWMASTPVTQAQYAAVTGQRPSRFKHAGDRAPVEQVSWNDCREFCDKLQRELVKLDRRAKRELTIRLPSEAEWEYACRAGTDTALYTGPLTIRGERNGPELDAIAWYGGNSGVEYEGAEDSSTWLEKQYEHRRAGAHPVGLKQPNAWGLYDLLGNVWEWCEDVWHGDYEGAPDDGTVWAGDAVQGSGHVFRGGSWASHAHRCRCGYRDGWHTGGRRGDRGFRFVLAATFNEGIRAFP